ncbi:MAG: glycosyltransferase family 39 protein [Holophagales bacterium]|nr:glycosyltransferase family 39 protein [Holophagales bacterium]
MSEDTVTSSGTAGSRAGLHRPMALVLAAAAAVLAAVLALELFSGTPRVGDEVSYALQGRIFSAGRLFLAPPAVAEAFAADNVILTADRWCGKYPPGFPLLLAAGWLLGTPWLVNPLLFGFAVYGLFRLGSKLYEPGTALLGALLFACLPFAFLQAASFMSHVASLTCAIWCLSLLADGEAGRSRPRLLAAGLLGGMAFLVRPMSAVFLLPVPGLLVLWMVYPRGARLRAAGTAIAGGLLPLAFLLFTQWQSFGSPFRSGYAVFDRWESFLGNRHGTRRLADIFRENVRWYGESLPRALWAIPGPPLLWLGLVLLKPRKGDLVAAAAAGGLVSGYLCYYYRDVIYGGPRFALESTAFFALLLARAVVNTASALAARVRWPVARFAPFPPKLAMATTVLLCAATVWREVPRIRAHALSYMGVPNDPMAGADKAGVGPDALILVDFEDPRRSLEYTAADAPSFSAYLFRNALDPSTGRRVFARALRGREKELMAAYPRAGDVAGRREPLAAHDG